jgi:hypothetical protein
MKIGVALHFDIHFFCFSENADTIIVGNGNRIIEWDLSKIAKSEMLEDIRGEPFLFNNEGDNLIVATSNSEMRLFDINYHIGRIVTNF